MDEFIWRALIGGVLVALFSAPLGCLVVWQRMAYFGAALSHAALLGVALGFVLGINLQLAILLVSILVSLSLLILQRYRSIANDTILGILAHSSLAFGLIALSFIPGLRVDLMGFLFGDILTISWIDIGWIAGGAVVIGGILGALWHPMLSTIIHPDLAAVDGHHQVRNQLIFLLLLSIAVAVSMQVVGLILIVSLLIIPPATARPFSDSPEQMLWRSGVVGIISVLLGLWMSLTLDTPAGPSIVASASVLFLLSVLKNGSRTGSKA